MNEHRSHSRRVLVLWLFALISLVGSTVLRAQDAPSGGQLTVAQIPRVTRPPRLSDFLNDVPREAELVVTDFRQYRPGDGEPVTQPTTAYVSYDADNLYVAFVCKDDPALIRARLSKRDQTVSDDRTMINLDTFSDRRRHYWFNVNPYGVQEDGIAVSGEGAYSNWDTLWYSDARITEDGYVTFHIIPFKSLRFPNTPQQSWGIVLARFITRNNEWSTWPYITARRPDYDAQAARAEGLTGISPGRNLQFIPYGFFAGARYLERSVGVPVQYQDEKDGRIGLDAKIVVKDAVALDVALNPDFSQVESDTPQVTVNQRYEVVYPEKRPFFLENANYFATPEQLFFSRRVVDPSLGVRTTGRSGSWTVGALVADDRAPGERVDEASPWHARHTPVGVARLQREFRTATRNYSMAAMATSVDFASTYNRVVSADTRLQLLPNWYFRGQAMTSRTKPAEGSHLDGSAYFAEWTHSGRHFISTTQYVDRSPDFRAQLGFFNRVDIRSATHNTGYNWRPVGRVMQSAGPELTGTVIYDHRGELQDWSVRPEFNLTAVRSTSLSVWHEQALERYAGHEFRRHGQGYTFSTEWWKWLAVSSSLTLGTGINYRPASGVMPFLGNRLEGSLGFVARLGPRLRLEPTYIYSGLRTDGDVAGAPKDTVVFDNHIVRTNLNYEFTRRFSLRWIGDYSIVSPNTSLMGSEATKHVGSDILFTYLLHPGTAVYVGYTDLYDDLRLSPALNPTLQRTAFPYVNTGRQLFVKMSYLLRY